VQLQDIWTDRQTNGQADSYITHKNLVCRGTIHVTKKGRENKYINSMQIRCFYEDGA